MPIKTITSLVDTYWVDSAGDVNYNFNLLKEEIDSIGVGGTWGHYKAWIKRADPGGCQW